MNRAERRAARRGGVGVRDCEPALLVRLLRPACPECSGPLDWFGGIGDAGESLGVDQVNAILERLDGSGSLAWWRDDGPELHFWRCRRRTCGESGVLMCDSEWQR